ncbi:MAG: ABC transporter permease, partial [Gemmataceae bacterium]
TAALAELRLPEVLAALLKTPIFGFLVGALSCYRGLTAPGGADGVGRAATGAVVASLFAVLVAAVVLVGFTRLLLAGR